MSGQQMVYFEMEGRPDICGCCDLLLIKFFVIGFTVLTAICGAVVVGLGLVLHGTDVFLPVVIQQYEPELGRMSMAIIFIAAAMVILCVVGCTTTVIQNMWFTTGYLLALMLCMAAQLSCALLVLFLREEVRKWAYDDQEEPCQDCVVTYQKALSLPTIAAVIMCATLGLQVCIMFSSFYMVRVANAEKKDKLLADILNDSPCTQSDISQMDFNSNTKIVNNPVEGDTLRVHCPTHSVTETTPEVLDAASPSKPCASRPSTSPAKVPKTPAISKISAYVHCTDYQPIPE